MLALRMDGYGGGMVSGLDNTPTNFIMCLQTTVFDILVEDRDDKSGPMRPGPGFSITYLGR